MRRLHVRFFIRIEGSGLNMSNHENVILYLNKLFRAAKLKVGDSNHLYHRVI